MKLASALAVAAVAVLGAFSAPAEAGFGPTCRPEDTCCQELTKLARRRDFGVMLERAQSLGTNPEDHTAESYCSLMEQERNTEMFCVGNTDTRNLFSKDSPPSKSANMDCGKNAQFLRWFYKGSPYDAVKDPVIKTTAGSTVTVLTEIKNRLKLSARNQVFVISESFTQPYHWFTIVETERPPQSKGPRQFRIYSAFAGTFRLIDYMDAFRSATGSSAHLRETITRPILGNTPNEQGDNRRPVSKRTKIGRLKQAGGAISPSEKTGPDSHPGGTTGSYLNKDEVERFLDELFDMYAKAENDKKFETKSGTVSGTVRVNQKSVAPSYTRFWGLDGLMTDKERLKKRKGGDKADKTVYLYYLPYSHETCKRSAEKIVELIGAKSAAVAAAENKDGCTPALVEKGKSDALPLGDCSAEHH